MWMNEGAWINQTNKLNKSVKQRKETIFSHQVWNHWLTVWRIVQAFYSKQQQQRGSEWDCSILGQFLFWLWLPSTEAIRHHLQANDRTIPIESTNRWQKPNQTKPNQSNHLNSIWFVVFHLYRKLDTRFLYRMEYNRNKCRREWWKYGDLLVVFLFLFYIAQSNAVEPHQKYMHNTPALTRRYSKIDVTKIFAEGREHSINSFDFSMTESPISLSLSPTAPPSVDIDEQ